MSQISQVFFFTTFFFFILWRSKKVVSIFLVFPLSKNERTWFFFVCVCVFFSEFDNRVFFFFWSLPSTYRSATCLAVDLGAVCIGVSQTEFVDKFIKLVRRIKGQFRNDEIDRQILPVAKQSEETNKKKHKFNIIITYFFFFLYIIIKKMMMIIFVYS